MTAPICLPFYVKSSKVLTMTYQTKETKGRKYKEDAWRGDA